MGLIIDADTHVAESEQMWALLETAGLPSTADHDASSRRHSVRIKQCLLVDRRKHRSKAGRQRWKQADYSLGVQTRAIEEGYTCRIQRTDGANVAS